jgi:hypothetical protein
LEANKGIALQSSQAEYCFMKTVSSLAVFAAALTILAITPRAHAAAVDFSKLYGTYKCTYTMTATGSTVTSSSMRVIVTKQGSKARMQISGPGSVPSSPGISFALLGNLTFAPNRIVKTDNILLAYFIMISSSTHFTSAPGRFTFRFTNPSLLNADLTYTLRFSGRRISIVGTGTTGGSPISINLRGTRVGS